MILILYVCTAFECHLLIMVFQCVSSKWAEWVVTCLQRLQLFILKAKGCGRTKNKKGWNILKGVCWSRAQTSAHIQKMSRFNDLESDRYIRHHENRTTSVSRTASAQDHVRDGRHANNVAGKSHFQWNQGLYICSVVRCKSYMMRPVRYLYKCQCQWKWFSW